MNRAARRQSSRNLARAPETAKVVSEIEKKLEEVREETKRVCISSSINMLMTVTAFILLFTFNFSKKDITKFMTELHKGFNFLQNGYLDINTLKLDMYEKKKVNVDDYLQ